MVVNIMRTCPNCGYSRVSISDICSECSKKHKQLEEDRWNSLTPDQKIEELRSELKNLRERMLLHHGRY